MQKNTHIKMFLEIPLNRIRIKDTTQETWSIHPKPTLPYHTTYPNLTNKKVQTTPQTKICGMKTPIRVGSHPGCNSNQPPLLLLLLLLFHMDYIYTRYLLAAFHMPPVSLGTDIASDRERHSSSSSPSSSYSFV